MHYLPVFDVPKEAVVSWAPLCHFRFLGNSPHKMKDVKSIDSKNIVSDHTSGRVMFLETMLTVNCFLGAGVDALRVVTVKRIFDLSRYIRTFYPLF